MVRGRYNKPPHLITKKVSTPRDVRMHCKRRARNRDCQDVSTWLAIVYNLHWSPGAAETSRCLESPSPPLSLAMPDALNQRCNGTRNGQLGIPPTSICVGNALDGPVLGSLWESSLGYTLATVVAMAWYSMRLRVAAPQFFSRSPPVCFPMGRAPKAKSRPIFPMMWQNIHL